jgi:DNA-binding response OmpR family regulator
MAGKTSRTVSILAMDDDLLILELYKDTLESAGYDVILAVDGVYGMALFEEIKPALVILDIKMPGPDGYQVLDSIRR